jgi:hypothetical protein
LLLLLLFAGAARRASACDVFVLVARFSAVVAVDGFGWLSLRLWEVRGMPGEEAPEVRLASEADDGVDRNGRRSEVEEIVEKILRRSWLDVGRDTAGLTDEGIRECFETLSPGELVLLTMLRLRSRLAADAGRSLFTAGGVRTALLRSFTTRF